MDPIKRRLAVENATTKAGQPEGEKLDFSGHLPEELSDEQKRVKAAMEDHMA